MPYDDNDERDRHTLRVADHGIDPSDLPAPPVPVPSVTLGPGDGATGRDGSAGVSDGARPRGGAGSALRDTLIWCGIPILIVILVRVFLLGFYEIPSRSMESTIEPGDRVITSKLTPKPFGLERGDVVVFHDPANWLSGEQSAGPLAGDYLIKRVIGLPGDTVECAGAGQPVTINGVAVDEGAYLKSGVQPSAFPFSVIVTAGHVFVMGDNRVNSADSRYHQEDGDDGLVPIDDVVGVGLTRYWPLGRIGVLDAHHEVFDQVPDRGATAASGSADAGETR